MPEHIRALIVILFFSSIVFYLAASPSREIVSNESFTRRRNVWYAVTLTAFLAHNFWIFALISAAIVHTSSKRETNRVALYFLILFAVPSNSMEIPGFGLINFFFALSYQRMLSLVILLPAFLHLSAQKETEPFGRNIPDKLLFGYLVLIVALFLRQTELTGTLRQAFYQFTDVFLPYYVISRSIKDKQSIREMLHCFVLAILIMAPIAIFESIRHWHMYEPLKHILGIPSRFSGYAERAGLARATVGVGSIPLGYLMVIGLGFYQYIQKQISSRFLQRLGLILLLAGLIAALARAPWVGAFILFFVFIITGDRIFSAISKMIVALIIAISLLSTVFDVERFFNILPYIGKAEEQRNVEYRERLLENSLIVIKRNPWFGSVDWKETPEMEELYTGQNIIDVVNTYVQVGLKTGFVGLSLFAGFFLTVCWRLFKSINLVRNKDEELHLLGRCLLATMISIMFIIFTVSSITIIPLVYWSVAAICVGFSNIAKSSEYLGVATGSMRNKQ